MYIAQCVAVVDIAAVAVGADPTDDAPRTFTVEVELVVDVSLFDVGQDSHEPGETVSTRLRGQSAWWKHAVGVFIIMNRQADLLEIVLALQPSRRLARRLHGRQQQGDENADDGDDHQKLNECKTDFLMTILAHALTSRRIELESTADGDATYSIHRPSASQYPLYYYLRFFQA